jgi:predicted RNA-binding Zn ribbon-like protein
MPAHRFELAGGHPVLDFVNTVSHWTGPTDRREEYLPGLGEAARFGRAAGLLAPAEAGRLASVRRPRAELLRLRALRARLERILREMTGERPAPAEDWEGLSRESGAAAAAIRLRPGPAGRVTRSVEEDGAGTAVLRYRLADRAVELLTSDAMTRLKSCPGCGWFFLDVSKNHSRRWCSMATCGSSAKSRAYYLRRRRGRPATPSSLAP